MEGDEELSKRFDQLGRLATEFFDDYVVICRLPRCGMIWRSSDPTWARGAMQRYMNRLDHIDVLQQTEKFREDGDG